MLKRVFVLLFVVLAVVMAVPKWRVQFLAVTVTPARDYVGARIAPGRLKAMADQLDVRLGRAEGFPINFEGWLRRDYTGPETDPWGRPWYLQSGRRSYVVGTMGPDGKQGTADDITETRKLPGSR